MEPLTRDQIKEIHGRLSNELPDLWTEGKVDHPFYVEFAKRIERVHGIGEEA